MEKRTILAFVLSFVVFIVWSQFYPSTTNIPSEDSTIEEKKEPLAQPVEDLKNQTLINPESSLTDEKQAAKVSLIEEKKIVIETPLYTATFSNRGPSLTAFQLNSYNKTLEPDSPPVELFTAQGQLKNDISLHFDNQYLKNAANLIYSIEGESTVLRQGQKNIDLSFKHITADGIIIEQIFSFSSEGYDIGVIVKIINQSGNQVNGDIKAVINTLPPEDSAKYYSFIGVAVLANNELEDFDSGDLEDKPELFGNIDWIAYENEYFISAIIPEEKNGAGFTGTLTSSGVISATHISLPLELPPSTEISKNYSLFLGPRDISILKNFGHKLDKAIDFGFFDIIAGPLHFLLKFFNDYVKNFGVSIIILTILIKIIFWPLTHKSQKSMKEMQKLQPLMAKIREKHKNDKQKLNQELMGLYKTYKVNPMGGCLPMLIQIPVFFALYKVLGSSIELRHAPFALWINDLSAPGRLFNLPFSIPFMDPPYGIPVLTLLMGASMFIQQKMQPMMGDPAQAKIMMFMPIMFTVMFINFPSGLVLYWLTNNILTVAQQYRINKKTD